MGNIHKLKSRLASQRSPQPHLTILGSFAKSMDNDKKWILHAIGATGAAAIGAYIWFRNSGLKVEGGRGVKTERKSYTEGGIRQYSLPAKGNSDLASSYREVMIVA